MLRFSLLLLLATGAVAAPAIDIDTAALVYQDAGMREQVRATLGVMPAHILELFQGNTSTPLSDSQAAAVTAAAAHGFRIDVFEPPALSVLAENLDAESVKRILSFLNSDLGKRTVAADIAASQVDEKTIDKIMSGDAEQPSVPARDALIAKIEAASHAAESNVQIFLSMGVAVAQGTAIGSGMDPNSVVERARRSGESNRQVLEENMREPLRRYIAYDYRDFSETDLKHLLAFLVSAPGKRYVTAYIASQRAGFDAMGKRCGEQLGDSLRELAMAQLATEGAIESAPPAGAPAAPGQAPDTAPAASPAAPSAPPAPAAPALPSAPPAPTL
jgi:hypothetical protein